MSQYCWIFSKQPCLGIDAAGRRVAHENLDRLSFEEILAPRTRGGNDKDDHRQAENSDLASHGASSDLMLAARDER